MSGDQADDPDAFDRKVAEALDAEAGMLREKSDLLLATGSGRTMDATSVLSEITLQLAVSVAWLDE
jgi:hypothetical protein